MTDINQEVLYNILDEATADKVCRFLAGYRMSFKKSFIVQKDIISDYKKMILYSSKKDIVKELAIRYELSQSSIYRIIADEK